MTRYPDAGSASVRTDPGDEARKAVLAWKRTAWARARGRGRKAREAAVLGLVRGLSTALGSPCRAVTGPEALFGKGCYLSGKRTVVLTGDSIVSALHETAHHLFGPDETHAVRWSSSLFADCFPQAYANLRRDGHLLVRERAV